MLQDEGYGGQGRRGMPLVHAGRRKQGRYIGKIPFKKVQRYFYRHPLPLPPTPKKKEGKKRGKNAAKPSLFLLALPTGLLFSTNCQTCPRVGVPAMLH